MSLFFFNFDSESFLLAHRVAYLIGDDFIDENAINKASSIDQGIAVRFSIRSQVTLS